MTVGVLQLELSIPEAMSLKDKRRVIKSLKDRIAHGHNVSIAEVGALDEHRRSIIGMAMVSNDKRYVAQTSSTRAPSARSSRTRNGGASTKRTRPSTTSVNFFAAPTFE